MQKRDVSGISCVLPNTTERGNMSSARTPLGPVFKTNSAQYSCAVILSTPHMLIPTHTHSRIFTVPFDFAALAGCMLLQIKDYI